MAGFSLELPSGLAGLQREAAREAAALDAPRGARRPPVEQWRPARTAEIDIRIARDGAWLHEGVLIRRPEIVRLFASLLRKDGDEFFLVTPAEKLRIEVEDAPFIAALLDVEGEGTAQILTFTTNVGDEIVAGRHNELRMEGDIPYIHVRGGLDARVSRAVLHQLAGLAAPGPDSAGLEAGSLGVWSDGRFFPLGPSA